MSKLDLKNKKIKFELIEYFKQNLNIINMLDAASNQALLLLIGGEDVKDISEDINDKLKKVVDRIKKHKNIKEKLRMTDYELVDKLIEEWKKSYIKKDIKKYEEIETIMKIYLSNDEIEEFKKQVCH